MEYVVGFHAIEELLRGKPASRAELLHGPNPGPRVRQLVERCRSLGVPVRQAEAAELDRLSGKADHRGALLALSGAGGEAGAETLSLGDCLDALAPPPGGRGEGAQPLILALDSITDPHNLGAILRSADKFGVDAVLIPARRSAQENETVRKTSAGAAAWIKSVVVGNLHRALLECRERGFWVVGADMAGRPAGEFDAKLPLVLVMGSEGKGLGKLARDYCDELVSIPCTGHVDSLNVSVATGILLYEIRRQQGFAWRAG